LQAPGIKRLERNALVVGVVGAAACIVGLVVYPAEQFLRSYLMGYIFWLNISLGSLAILMLAHVTGAEWAYPVRRLLEAAAPNVYGMAALFLPLLVGIRHLYPWAHSNALQNDKLLQSQHNYLNVPFFALRTVFYFASWMVLVWFLTRWSAL